MRIFQKRLVNFISEYVTRSSCTYVMRRRYLRFARLIEDFEKAIGMNIYTDSFDDATSERFIDFLQNARNELYQGRKYKSSTISNFRDILVTILRKAERSGCKVNLERLTTINIRQEYPNTVYLTMEELGRLNKLKLPKGQAKVRDMFLIGCFTALRFSDYSRLTEDNFQNELITITTQKTETRVVIPIHRIIKEIIARNKGYAFLRCGFTNTYFNISIKKICQKAGINGDVLVEYTEGCEKKSRIMKKWEMVSSHTARRTGATNMYLAGISPFRIMLITGHQTEEAFYRYIRIRKEENAKALTSHPFFS